MLWLAFAVSCSLAIAMIFKHGERSGLDRTALLTVNYGVAFVVSVLLLGREAGGFEASGGVLTLGIVLGALFIGGFYLFSYAIREVGMGLATGVMRLSVAIPFFVSWLVWGDEAGTLQLLGLAIAGVAFFLIARPAAKPGRPDPNPSAPDGAETHSGLKAVLVLGLLFLSGGLVDVSMKAFGTLYAETTSQTLFLLFVFGVAFLIGAVVVIGSGLRTGHWPRRAAYGWGTVLGLVNYGSADFLLRALADLPGTFVFPANSIAIVMGATLLGIVVWQERLTLANWVGIGAAAVALGLLSA